MPIQATHPTAFLLCTGLALYAMDLAQWRGTFVFALYAATLSLTLTTAWCRLIETDDDAGGAAVLLLLLEIFLAALVYILASVWIHAQCVWAQANTRQALLASLHALLPPLSAALATVEGLQPIITIRYGADVAANALPYCFAALLLVGMTTLGSLVVTDDWQKTMASPDASDSNEHKGHGISPTNGSHVKPTFWVNPSVAWGHLALLYTVPLAMHLGTHLRRILSTTWTMDDVHDLVLVSVVPYLLGHYGLPWWHNAVWPHPYAPSMLSLSSPLDWARPFALVVVAALSLQQRYLLRASHALSYYFFDNAAPSWLLSVYWTAALASLLFVAAFWGRKSAVTTTTADGTTHAPQLLLGEYHEDVVQLALSSAGLFLGKSVGLPWNFTPLPVLAFLGLTLWMTTRMLRYLAIILFVVHAAGVVIFTYRFAGMADQRVSLPIGLAVSLPRLGLLVTSTSIVVGLSTGLAVRSSGGWGSRWLKRFDVTGWTWVAYCLALTTLEIGLWKRPLPNRELVGVGVAVQVDSLAEEEPLYEAWWVFGTSVVIAITTAFCRRVKIMASPATAVAVSLAAGKSISIYIDMVEKEGVFKESASASPGYDVWLRAIVTALVCVVLFAPRVFVKPVHLKAHRSSYTLSDETNRTIAICTLLFLPMALLVAVPFVIYPFANALRGDIRGDSFYRVQASWSEMAGASCLLWGLASLAMLNYYLPDGGGQVWKKISALAFLLGLGIVFCAPALGIRLEAASNPYAAISSLGSQLIRKGKGRTGGWGLLLAGLATLLAITGPLELKERRNDAVHKDGMLLFRTMVFSLLFGGGLSWFIVMLCMRDAGFVHLVLTTVCCLTSAFLGTVAAVLGHYLALEEFSEVTQIFSIWLISLPLLAPIAGLPQLFGSSGAHAFGVDGWLSTYLVVGAIAAFSFCIAVRNRSQKNPATRGIANTSCFVAWGCAIVVLYGRYGVAGLDVNYDVTTILGVPASILGSFVLMPILLALEGEIGTSNRTRRVSSSTKSARSFLGINSTKLSTRNVWVVLIVATAAVFCLGTLYAIFLRGAGLGKLFGAGATPNIHEQVFSVFGSSDANEDADHHDLAALAVKVTSHSKALATSAKLAAGGFWTSSSFFWPLWQLFGLIAVLPNLYYLVQEEWLGVRVPSSTVGVSLPLHVFPLLSGIPTLQAASVVSCCGGLVQWLVGRHH